MCESGRGACRGGSGHHGGGNAKTSDSEEMPTRHAAILVAPQLLHEFFRCDRIWCLFHFLSPCLLVLCIGQHLRGVAPPTCCNTVTNFENANITLIAARAHDEEFPQRVTAQTVLREVTHKNAVQHFGRAIPLNWRCLTCGQAIGVSSAAGFNLQLSVVPGAMTLFVAHSNGCLRRSGPRLRANWPGVLQATFRTGETSTTLTSLHCCTMRHPPK